MTRILGLMYISSIIKRKHNHIETAVKRAIKELLTKSAEI